MEDPGCQKTPLALPPVWKRGAVLLPWASFPSHIILHHGNSSGWNGWKLQVDSFQLVSLLAFVNTQVC
jgi:hypothetical protein